MRLRMFEVEGLSFEQYFSINDVKVHKRIFKQFRDIESWEAGSRYYYYMFDGWRLTLILVSPSTELID